MTVFRARDLFVRQRTRIVNALRGYMNLAGLRRKERLTWQAWAN
jgi:hypothetical protein